MIAIPRRPQPEDISGVVLLWNPITGQKRHFVAGKGIAMAVAFSPDGKTLAVAHGPDVYHQRLHLLDAETGQAKSQLKGPTERIQSLVFAPDGNTLVSTSRIDTLRLWDLKLGCERANFANEDDRVVRAAFTRDGRTLATLVTRDGGEKNTALKLRDGRTGKLQSESSSQGYGMWALAAGPDRQMVALGCSDNIVRLRRSVLEPPVIPMPRHLSQAWGIAFAPDGHTLVSVGGDLAVRLSDPATAQERAVLSGK